MTIILLLGLLSRIFLNLLTMAFALDTFLPVAGSINETLTVPLINMTSGLSFLLLPAHSVAVSRLLSQSVTSAMV